MSEKPLGDEEGRPDERESGRLGVCGPAGGELAAGDDDLCLLRDGVCWDLKEFL